MKKILFCISIYFSIGISESIGQTDSLLRRQLQGKNNLTEIMNVVNDYYTNPENINRLGSDAVNRNLKHWRRYEWYMSSRLGPDGEFVNINEKLTEATGLQQNRKLTSKTITPNTIESTAGNWSLLGPTNTTVGIGRIDRLAFHPTDANTVYAGTAGGGLWKTTDAGTSWTNLTPDIPCLGISGIAIDPVNPNIIYILTGDGDSDSPTNGGIVQGFGYMRTSIGVLKSTNGGANWIKTGIFSGANYTNLRGFRLTINPFNPNMLFACTNRGLFRTTDGGNTWNLADGRGIFYNLKFKPGSSNICYAVSMDGSTAKFFKSIDSGVTFADSTTINAQINNPTDRIDIAVAPSKSSALYILAGGVPNAAGFFKGLFRSDDSGNTFVLQSNSPNILGNSNIGQDNNNQSWYDLAIAVSNNSSARVTVGAVRIWSSSDSGAIWNFRSNNIHEDVHELGYHPVDNKLWAATDGGVFSSTDNGLNWTSHFESMSISQVFRIAVSPSNYLDMICGMQDNGMQKRNTGSSTFTQLNSADGFTVGYDPQHDSVFYAIINLGIRRFTNNGNNVNTITPVIANNPMGMSMAMHTTNDSTLFIGSTSVWRTVNAGQTWNISPGIQAGWFMRTCPSNSNRIYVAGGTAFNSAAGILRRSDDGGVTWPGGNILTNDNGFPDNYPKITSINVDPNNSLRVWITFGGFTDNLKVYYADYNANPVNWVNMSGTLPNLPVNCIALDNNNNAYIGTDNGVYYRGTGMSDWVPFYNSLPYVPVTDLVISESNNRIRASTFGRGIWASDLYSTCVSDLNITGTLEGQEFYAASNNVVSTASLVTSEGSKVQMRGGNEVKLEDGFTARESTQFRAMIGPCGSGGAAGFRVTTIDSTTKLEPSKYLPPVDGRRSMIHIHSAANGEIRFEVNQKQNGESDLLLTDKMGNIVRSKKITTSQKGKWNSTISTAGLASGTYYLNVLLDKRVEHMQEVIIK